MNTAILIFLYILCGVGLLWFCAVMNKRKEGTTPEELRELIADKWWLTLLIILLWPGPVAWWLGELLAKGFAELLVWLVYGTTTKK